MRAHAKGVAILELPEAAVIADQVNHSIVGRRIESVEAGHSPHKWAWFYGDPTEYPAKLTGKTVDRAVSWGGLVDIAAGDVNLYLGDGTNLTLLPPGSRVPQKHQLRLDLDDGSILIGSVQMYGGLWACPSGEYPSEYLVLAMEKPSPLRERFGEDYFRSLFHEDAGRLSLKALLATEQRIPGLGNGVLQDILFKARLHPRKKVESLRDHEKGDLYLALRDTLRAMYEGGGRDTEKMLDGRPGGYRTVLSRNTVGKPCPVCGDDIAKEAYMGGSVYFCPSCQTT